MVQRRHEDDRADAVKQVDPFRSLAALAADIEHVEPVPVDRVHGAADGGGGDPRSQIIFVRASKRSTEHFGGFGQEIVHIRCDAKMLSAVVRLLNLNSDRHHKYR